MSGHNKWSKIKHKKATSDAQKSRVFSKLVKALKVEARLAGGDKNAPGLKKAVEKARNANMPKENIERAIKGASEGAQIERVTYEAYGPGGTAIIIEGLTDNKNRTSAEIKHILSKLGLSIASPGSATWAFEKTSDEWRPKNVVSVLPEDEKKLNELVGILLEHEDVEEVYTNAE